MFKSGPDPSASRHPMGTETHGQIPASVFIPESNLTRARIEVKGKYPTAFSLDLVLSRIRPDELLLDRVKGNDLLQEKEKPRQ